MKENRCPQLLEGLDSPRRVGAVRPPWTAPTRAPVRPRATATSACMTTHASALPEQRRPRGAPRATAARARQTLGLPAHADAGHARSRFHPDATMSAPRHPPGTPAEGEPSGAARPRAARASARHDAPTGPLPPPHHDGTGQHVRGGLATPKRGDGPRRRPPAPALSVQPARRGPRRTARACRRATFSSRCATRRGARDEQHVRRDARAARRGRPGPGWRRGARRRATTAGRSVTLRHARERRAEREERHERDARARGTARAPARAAVHQAERRSARRRPASGRAPAASWRGSRC